jgi:hypothetical protein
VKRIHVAAAAALVLLVVPTTTGCFNGLKATTTMQATMNSGNGTDATQGPLHIEAATVVIGPDGSNSATLTTRIVNTGAEPDALTYATINGEPASMTPDSGNLDAGSSVSFGFDSQAWINAYDFTGTVATYVPVELGFRNAGLVKMSVLVVPAVGYYEGIAPTPATKPATG